MRSKIRLSLKNKRGTSLLECILSLVIFTMITTMVASMMGTALNITRVSTDTENAVNAAGDAAERFNGTTADATVGFVFTGDGVAGSVSVRAELAKIEGSNAGGNKTAVVWKIIPLPEPPPIPPPVGP